MTLPKVRLYCASAILGGWCAGPDGAFRSVKTYREGTHAFDDCRRCACGRDGLGWQRPCATARQEGIQCHRHLELSDQLEGARATVLERGVAEGLGRADQ